MRSAQSSASRMILPKDERVRTHQVCCMRSAAAVGDIWKGTCTSLQGQCTMVPNSIPVLHTEGFKISSAKTVSVPATECLKSQRPKDPPNILLCFDEISPTRDGRQPGCDREDSLSPGTPGHQRHSAANMIVRKLARCLGHGY